MLDISQINKKLFQTPLAYNVFKREDAVGEKCGVIGVFGEGMEAARLVYTGLWALQHRGQESSGICSTNGKTIKIHTGMGLVAHVYKEEDLGKLKGHAAIGHNRYSTSGGSTSLHNQPVIDKNNKLALAHNGNLPSTKKLEEFCNTKKIDISGLNDSELMHKAIVYYLSKGYSIETSVKNAFPLFTGVFCILLLTKDKLIAVRDEYGIRPLSLGKLNGGYVIASETCVLQTMSASCVRDIKPGEMAVIDKTGLRSFQLAKPKNKLDVFEFIYFARPDSMLLGKSVNEVRKRLGRYLAREYPIKADVVIPVPDSAIPVALGYSLESGVAFDHGFIKNRYIHRTFIRPAQKLRDHDLQLKLNPLPEVINGKNVIVIDDSIVRGNTSRKIISLIRSAGAKKVHLLVSSPPLRFPDFYGIDTPKQQNLIAATKSTSEIAKHLGADCVRYLSYEGMIDAIGVSESLLSTSCFNGIYPVSIQERIREINYSF